MGVLAVLTVVPGPDRAVVTKRAVTSGRQSGPHTVGGITAGPFVRLGGCVLVPARARTPFEEPAVRRAMDRVTGVVLTGFGGRDGVQRGVTQPGVQVPAVSWPAGAAARWARSTASAGWGLSRCHRSECG